MSDIGVIVWKEWRELLGQRGLRGKSGIVLNLAVFGIVLPLQFGTAWVTSPVVALAWSWVPMFFVMMVVADAFAGERERHTLETLLASRLSDHAILFGKMAAAIGYGVGLTAASLVLGLITINLAVSRNAVVMYPLSNVFAIAVLGLLGALLVSAGGVVISLRAATVRQAEQTLGGAIMLVLFAPLLAIRAVPAPIKARFAADHVSAATLSIVTIAILLVIDTGMIRLAMHRFQRSRLIADV